MLDLSGATAGPSLDLALRGRPQALDMRAPMTRSRTLVIDRMRGHSPRLHLATRADMPYTSEQDPLVMGRIGVFVTIMVGVLLLAGGGAAYWSHLKAQARHQIEAAELSLDGEGLRAAILGGHSDLIPAFRRLGVKLADTDGVIEAAVIAADPALLGAVLAGGARWANESHAAQMLGYVIHQGDPKMLQALLDAGAKPEDPAFGGPMILSQMAAEAGQWSVLTWVIEHRPKESFTSQNGDTIAAYLAGADLPQLITLAHNRWGVDFNGPATLNGDTPLHIAAASKSSGVVAKLLAMGCDPSVTNATGITPLQNALTAGDDATLAAFVASKNKSVIEAMLGGTGLESLINAGMAVTTTALLSAGVVTPDAVLDNHVTLLGQAAVKGRETVVEALLEAKADPNLSFAYGNTEGVTPLMLAALGGFDSIARVLIDHGAAKDATAQNGFTVKMAAQRGGNAEIIYLIEE